MHIIENPMVPFSTPIHQGFPHEAKVEIHADAYHGPNYGFVIDFVSSHGVDMHLNCRINENCLVLNSFEHGHWKREERHCNPFHGHFHLKIKNHHGHFAIHVNGHHVCHFHHRHSTHHIHRMDIRGDIRIGKIHFERFHHHNGGGVQIGGGSYPMYPTPPVVVAAPPPLVVQQPPVYMAPPAPVVVVEEGHHHHHRHHHGLLHDIFHHKHHHHHC